MLDVFIIEDKRRRERVRRERMEQARRQPAELPLHYPSAPDDIDDNDESKQPAERDTHSTTIVIQM